ncbi:Gp138 family membrane-puncturing spike protein [Burkholderia cepacia]|uniref:Gp138 family membrane-puncturing spike protein n=1 Tax=Burkholderia cepacia TaxID=292 RepID=UPI00264F91A3|nr:Gp138 family membrane-puncturing spike protein [Burkholderia cepacia]MDN7895887.1 Gp138 family membrane-puncturing spike protein [Burkholderia cepacia]
MDRKERVDDELTSLRTALRGWQVGIWTALPGVIESFDDDAQTCVVQPAIKVPVRANDGTVTTAALPPVVDCPVQFPSGGDCTLTFPVASGDECLIVFASRSFDAWWQSGGVQEQAALRMHDLSDGFALLGFRSRPRALAGVSTSSAQLRSDDGRTFVDLNPSAGTLKFAAPTSIELTAPTVTVNASTSLTVNSPQSGFSGTVIVQGLFSFLGGMIGSAVSGAAAVITGMINFVGTLTANGKRIDDTHTHNGVQPGPGNSGNVN